MKKLNESYNQKYPLWRVIVIALVALLIAQLIGAIIKEKTETKIETKIEQSIVLKSIWQKRPDLQKEFPNGYKNSKWTIADWAKKYGYREYYSLMQYQPRLEMEKEYIYQKYLPIERTLVDIASRDYDIKEYNCVNFSKDLKKELKKKGIESVLIVGKTPTYSKNTYHCWIGLQLESISGQIVSDLMRYEPIEIYR